MRTGRLVLAAALAVAAVLLALLASDVGTTSDDLQRDDVRYAAGRTGADWRADTVLPLDPAGRLLGAGADAELRRALVLFRRARVSGDPFDALERQGARGAAQAALQRIVREGDPARASQAGNLAGVLALTGTAVRGAATPVERALGAFEQAYRLDRSNEAAKHNLELTLKLLEARGTRPGSSPGSASGSSGRRGAGTGRPGEGY